ncbi:MAG: hypothetical protein AB2598_10765 [Candidatus Thiodiazotropha sp.]
MPLTLTLTEDVLPAGSEQAAIECLTDAMLERQGLTGNQVIDPNITANVNILPINETYSGGRLTVPGWNGKRRHLPSPIVTSKEAFFDNATEIIHELSDGQQPRENIYRFGIDMTDVDTLISLLDSLDEDCDTNEIEVELDRYG